MGAGKNIKIKYRTFKQLVKREFMNQDMLKIGAPLPQFGKLPGVDGKSYSASDFNQAKVMVIVFSCNHCPYVRAYEDRMIAFQRDYSPHGVELVAINSNDIRNYPDDSFEKMVARAKEKKFNFKYLRDEDATDLHQRVEECSKLLYRLIESLERTCDKEQARSMGT